MTKISRETKTGRTTKISRFAAVHLTSAAIVALCVEAVRRRLQRHSHDRNVTAEKYGSRRRSA